MGQSLQNPRERREICPKSPIIAAPYCHSCSEPPNQTGKKSDVLVSNCGANGQLRLWLPWVKEGYIHSSPRQHCTLGEVSYGRLHMVSAISKYTSCITPYMLLFKQNSIKGPCNSYSTALLCQPSTSVHCSALNYIVLGHIAVFILRTKWSVTSNPRISLLRCCSSPTGHCCCHLTRRPPAQSSGRRRS